MAGLTKQQEVIVGVGLLALLGYFAFKPSETVVVAPDKKGDDSPPPTIPLTINFLIINCLYNCRLTFLLPLLYE